MIICLHMLKVYRQESSNIGDSFTLQNMLDDEQALLSAQYCSPGHPQIIAQVILSSEGNAPGGPQRAARPSTANA
jgi:hypothetical protein